jgi:cystathionine beta-lyase family protein involved in aluminum resistance
MTNQRNDILSTFKDIIFVAGGVLKQLAEKGVKSTRSMLLNLTKPTIKEDIPDNKEILSMRPSKGGKNRKEGIIQELAQLTMSMVKKANPVTDTINFYKPENLYPFHPIDDY